MIKEIVLMNGYGIYVWSAFSFTLISFAVLYTVIKIQLVKEQRKIKQKFARLDYKKIKSAETQNIYREILDYTSISKI